jgi:hypothetical protein
MKASFARAAIASVSDVMKVCCTHPACWASLLRRSIVSLAFFRNVAASSWLPAGADA